jgi:hypothetical protein
MPVHRRRSLLPVLLLPLLLAGIGCDLVTAEFRSEETTEWRKSYELPAGGQVEIVNVNGRINVEPSTGRTVEVVAIEKAKGSSPEDAKAALKRITIQDEQSSFGIRIETKIARKDSLFGGGGLQVEYRVKVPADAGVKLQTVNGGVDVRGLTGSVRAETTNGGVEADALAGPVEASTTNGGLKIGMAQVSGDIRLECTNGGIRLSVPKDARATISASVTNGGIDTSGLSIETSGETSRRRLEGRLNGGGPAIHLETTNGGVHLSGR